MYASEIKISIVSWVIPQLGVDDVLGSEVPFLDQARKADLVIVRPDNLVAIEIKGPRDDLRRLDAQLEHYQSMFLETYVAAHELSVSDLKHYLPRSIGIISVSDEGPPKLFKKAVHKKFLNKTAATRWLSASQLKTAKYETIQLRRERLLQTIPKKELSALAISAAHSKVVRRYNIFINELGKSISEDDITVLSSPYKIRL